LVFAFEKLLKPIAVIAMNDRSPQLVQATLSRSRSLCLRH
jgi:hypothetical protein